MTTAEMNDEDIRRAATGLIADYSRLLDDRDAESWSALFAPNGRLHVKDRDVTGTADLRSFAEQSPRGVHLPGVPSIEREGEEVRCYSALVFINSNTGGVHGVRNEDRLVWHDGQLLFLERRMAIVAQTVP
jgi:hypothetical protein